MFQNNSWKFKSSRILNSSNLGEGSLGRFPEGRISFFFFFLGKRFTVVVMMMELQTVTAKFITSGN